MLRPATNAQNPVTTRFPSGSAHPREAPMIAPNIKNNLFITQLFVSNAYSFAIPGYLDALISGYFSGKKCEVSCSKTKCFSEYFEDCAICFAIYCRGLNCNYNARWVTCGATNFVVGCVGADPDGEGEGWGH